MTVLLIAFSVAAVAAKCTDAQTKAFEKWDRDWSIANDKGNRAELEKIYADDFEGIGGLSLGVDNKKTIIDNVIKNVGANPNTKSYSHNYLITCTPAAVTIVHRNTNVTTSDGKESTNWSRTTHVLEKRNGNWQAVSSVTIGMAGDGRTMVLTELDGDQASMRRDLDWYRKNVADNFVGMVNSEGFGNISYTKAEQLSYLEGAWKDSKSTFDFMRISDLQVRVEDNMGFMSGVRHSKGINTEGKPFENKFRFSRTYVKKDGKWMMLAATNMEMKDSEAK